MNAITPTQRRPDYNRARREALTLLEKHSIAEPPVDPVSIARSEGVKVLFGDFDAEHHDVSGFYEASERTIYVNRNEYPLRMNFTIAHELGHAILHHDWAASNDYRVFRAFKVEVNEAHEKEANAFAAHLLVPRFMLDPIYRDFSVEDLSRAFAVSVPVIQNRLAWEYGYHDR